jgi:hypothetical protein
MDVGTLTAHLENQRKLLASAKSNSPPERHVKAGTLQAYKEYLQREITRTELKIEVVKARPVRITKAK